MAQRATRRTRTIAAYVMPMYWQCPHCLFVVHDFPPTPPELRVCAGCSAKGHTVYTWPGTAGEVYHAALHNLGESDDWTSVALRGILLCSLTDLHNSRLMWSILVAMGCPNGVANSIVKSMRQPAYKKLFHTFVGEKRRKFERSGDTIRFWPALESLRRFRNEFVHGEPEKRDKEMKEIAKGLQDVICAVSEGIETAFQALTNSALAKIRSRS